MSLSIPLATRRTEKITEWLNRYRFHFFVTLTTHDAMLSYERMRDLLKAWDARMNRALYGPKWRKHADELLWTFAFPEKPDVNPHWHLLIRIVETDPVDWFRRANKLNEIAGPTWQELVPAGTVEVKKITHDHDRVTDYVAKELGREIQYEGFITPDEFRRF